MREDHFTPQALNLLCQEAGKQAASWQGGVAEAAAAATPWQLKVGLVSGCGLLALVVIAAPIFFEPSRIVSMPDPRPPQAAPALALASFAPASPPEPTRWEGNELVIDFDRMPLAKAIPLLARATSTLVNGSHLLTAPALVTLHLRTRDVKAAWHRLLHGHASFSTSCSASACQVWINSEIAASTATVAPDHENAPPGNEREQISDDRREELESQPDGSC